MQFNLYIQSDIEMNWEYSQPPLIAAQTGMDVLSHAVEGFININHQPICDSICVEAAHLVLDNMGCIAVLLCNRLLLSKYRKGNTYEQKNQYRGRLPCPEYL